MGNLKATVDPITRRIIFGAQKQGDKMLDAISIFVDEYLTNHGHMNLPITSTPTDQDWVDVRVMDIEAALDDIARKVEMGEKLSSADILFAQLFLGLQEFHSFCPGCVISHECITDTGKYVFYVVTGGQGAKSTAVPTGNTAEVIEHARKTASKEEEAVALIEEILKDCPNRGDYPDDDALAAILYGEVYWKKGVH